jgi:hypothetical protein
MRVFLFFVLAATLLLLLLATAVMPELWSFLLVAVVCPNQNYLSPVCGDVTLGFVVLRLIQAVFLAAFAYVLWRLLDKDA